MRHVLLAEANVDIPEPDYHEEEEEGEGEGQTNGQRHLPYAPKFKDTVMGRAKAPASSGPIINAEGLIEPRKLPNPVLESREHQELHRELFMNKKMGIDVLHRKPEFQKEIERRRTQKEKKDKEAEKKTSFEKKLEEQATKLRSVGHRKLSL